MEPQVPPPEPDLPWLGPPIDARPLFAPEQRALLATLHALRPDDWQRAAVPGWTVHDVAAHLLGDFYGRLARERDGHTGGPAPAPGEPLAAFIHRINQEWVDAHARVSPASLTGALEVAGAGIAAHFTADALRGTSLGVSWAGAEPAPRWLDVARDFTEFWTHRQQIRHAAGLPTDSASGPLAAVLDTFMRALPHTLRDTAAPPGTRVRMAVTDPAGAWTATATGPAPESGTRWSLAAPHGDGEPDALVRLDAETAWRLCVRGVEPAAALARAEVRGDRALAEAACGIVSIIR
ncbi:maleylpyruvate isomerase family mycothiol-dependent enzyme [Streptomyces sp. WMMC500]|uniref:maleylpyruvate isomerase family mycothiol-dependent enzyme n=1 Tax=Streptomyces sp. WMMC500 TaxID=3015154 RepID=UPI00248CC8D3|nr:maleylpyruvate isomerase family mycothiol-dependent enzyme [Streptomyces sp. WMMC500]WBB61110.1 maleylpyruvate isomerase family mycothiol-dependent enzyme [Streptomyces sp. WMMC500]